MREASFLAQRYKVSFSWVACPGRQALHGEGGWHRDKHGRQEKSGGSRILCLMGAK